MSEISFIGSYSGIDKSTIDKLMQAEKLPLNQLNNKKTDITAKQNAWKDVNTRLNSLFDKLKALQSPSTFTARTAKVGDESIISASASSDAIDGKYNINVGKLATNTRIIGQSVAGAYADGKFTDLNISGSFAIKNHNGEKTATIEIKAGDSLKTIVNSINEKTKDTGINATIIDSKLVLSDEKTGARGITLEDTTSDTLSKLGLSPGLFTGGNDAEFTINDIPVTSESNIVSDKVLGLTINLNKEGQTTLTVSTDTEKLTKTVKDFVDQYNSTMSFIEEQLAVGTVTDSGTIGRGKLAGDSSLRSLHASLRSMVTDTLGGNTGTNIKDISALGIKTTDKSGKLSFDSSKLLEEFAKDPQNVEKFFSNEVGGKNSGFIAKLNDKINTYISTKDGLIKSKNESLDRSLKDLNSQIDRFNDRMIKKEEYYTKMFSALDVAMMKAESQMEWLNGQISAMNIKR